MFFSRKEPKRGQRATRHNQTDPLPPAETSQIRPKHIGNVDKIGNKLIPIGVVSGPTVQYAPVEERGAGQSGPRASHAA
jgi:hypothetical protein